MSPIVSIIVPIYNMYGKLHHMKNWLSLVPGDEIEVILIDDFTSTDATLEIEKMLDDLAIKQAKLIKGEFKSPGLARNAGITEASGRWIVFADSDDILHIEELASYLSGCSPDSIQVFQFQQLNFNTKEIIEPLSQTWSASELVINLGIWRMAFPALFINNCKFQNMHMGEDVIFFLDVYQLAPRIIYSSLHSYDYLRGSGSQLTASKESIGDLIVLLNELEGKLGLLEKSGELARYLYFKNTLSSIRHLGVIKSFAFVKKSFLLFLLISLKEKCEFTRIVGRLLKP